MDRLKILKELELERRAHAIVPSKVIYSHS